MGPYVSVYNMNLLCFTRWPGRMVHEEGTEVVASMALQRSFGTAPKVAVADASASASGRDGEASADSAESETPSAARRLRCAASQRFSDVDSARKTRKTRDAAPRVAFVWRPRRERPARLAMPREVGTDAFAMQIDMSAVRKGTRARVAGLFRLAGIDRALTWTWKTLLPEHKKQRARTRDECENIYFTRACRSS